LIMYYGSKISENMTRTPEGYLICHNVPIGRTGSMEYYGEEIGLEDKRGQIVKVSRSPDELFSKATMASFEGKPVANEHPSNNIDLNTVSIFTKGHIQNVRKDGDFLIGDLYITDQGLIAEIENGKREVSCGYDCLWLPVDDSQYEQKNIVGNHVAVVQKGRAGPRVAIKDAKPEEVKTERRNKMGSMSKNILAAMGFKAFAQDAEPEEIAKAMDALGEAETSGEQPKEGTIEECIKLCKECLDMCKTCLEECKKCVEECKSMTATETGGADAELAALEKEMGGMDESGSATVEPEKKEEEEKPTPAADSLKAFVAKMKPVIMSIPDAKTRDEAAKQFIAAVRDAAKSNTNGYGAIMQVITGHKQNAMDTQQHKTMTQSEAAEASCSAWNKQNAHVKGGK
jgi:hypothetical protein